jgi:hypothetical protein
VGLDFILNLSKTHSIFVKVNLGHGTNNLGEFKALFFLFKIALHRNVNEL